MSIVANDLVREAGEFQEGTVSLSTGTWHCLTHEATVKAGRDCAFCVWDHLGPEGFERWVLKNKQRL